MKETIRRFILLIGKFCDLITQYLKNVRQTLNENFSFHEVTKDVKDEMIERSTFCGLLVCIHREK